MRALRLLALAAALVAPAAAAHAQVGVYVGPSHRVVASVYGGGYGYGPVVYAPARPYWAHERWDARREWREHRYWDRARWDHERRW